MKYKFTEGFKQGVRGIVLYVITAILVFPVYHLIKGDFSWADSLINAGLNIGIALVLSVFFFFGSQIPQKNNK